MTEVTRPAKRKATPPRAERPNAALVEVLVLAEWVEDPVCEAGAAVPEAVSVPLAVVGVKGAVTPKPGSAELGTLAAKAAKVFAPVVGGLMAPYMPEWQWGTLAQKNQMGFAV